MSRLFNDPARFAEKAADGWVFRGCPCHKDRDAGSTMSITIGVSLKAYLGYRDTLRWASVVAEMARSRSHSSIELFVLPAFPALAAVRDILTGSGVAVGGQDIAADDAGNQTGEVTGAMLADAGCHYAEVGHSERRRQFGETEKVRPPDPDRATRPAGSARWSSIGCPGKGTASPLPTPKTSGLSTILTT